MLVFNFEFLQSFIHYAVVDECGIMASNDVQLPPEIRERVEELEQELAEGNIS